MKKIGFAASKDAVDGDRIAANFYFPIVLP